MLFTGYIAKYGEFNLDVFLSKRQLKTIELLQFLHWFVSPLIGKEKWKTERTTQDFSDLLTVSDEVYLYLTIESNYDKWLYLYRRTVSDNDERQLTNLNIANMPFFGNSLNKRPQTRLPKKYTRIALLLVTLIAKVLTMTMILQQHPTTEASTSLAMDGLTMDASVTMH